MIELLYEVLYLGPVGLFTLGIFDFPYSIRIAVYAVVICQFLMKKRYVKLVLMFIIDKVQYLKLSEIEKKKIDYRKKLGKMKKYKAAYEEGETLEEYKSRVKELVPKQALDFIDDYEKLLYGPNGSK